MDCGNYYRVPLDARSLDYGLYVEEGDHAGEVQEDYNSDNTVRLMVEQGAELLTELPASMGNRTATR